MTPDTRRLPAGSELKPWYEAICALRDDAVRCESIAARAREIVVQRYSEAVSRRKHVEYFTSLTPGG